MSYNARNDEIRDNITRCAASGKRNAVRWQRCDSVVDLDLRVKPRDPEASIRVALRDVQCPRCNGHGRPRIIALARDASI